MRQAPQRVGGSSKSARWLDALWDFAVGCRILPGPGYRVKEVAGGTILELDVVAGGAPAAVSLGVFKFVSIAASGDYINAQPLTTPPSTFGAAVTVARPQHLWASVTSETIDGATISYSDIRVASNTVIRRATTSNGLYYADQITYPPYQTNELILVAKVAYTGVAAAPNYIELTPRYWSS